MGSKLRLLSKWDVYALALIIFLLIKPSQGFLYYGITGIFISILVSLFLSAMIILLLGKIFLIVKFILKFLNFVLNVIFYVPIKILAGIFKKDKYKSRSTFM